MARTPKTSEIDFRRLSPFRVPGWRWQWAQELVHRRRRLRPDADPSLREAVTFLRILSRANTPAQVAAVDRRFGELRLAYTIHTTGGVVCDEIQSRLLAAEPFEGIAAKSGLPVGVIRHYEKLFFNVTDFRDAHDWLLAVTGNGFGKGGSVAEGDTWRFIGLAAGPVVLDLLIADFLHRRTPVVADRHLYAEKLRFLVRDYADGLRSPVPSQEIVKDMTRLFGHLFDPACCWDYATMRLHMDCIRMAASLPPLPPFVAEPKSDKIPIPGTQPRSTYSAQPQGGDRG